MHCTHTHTQPLLIRPFRTISPARPFRKIPPARLFRKILPSSPVSQDPPSSPVSQDHSNRVIRSCWHVTVHRNTLLMEIFRIYTISVENFSQTIMDIIYWNNPLPPFTMLFWILNFCTRRTCFHSHFHLFQHCKWGGGGRKWYFMKIWVCSKYFVHDCLGKFFNRNCVYSENFRQKCVSMHSNMSTRPYYYVSMV